MREHGSPWIRGELSHPSMKLFKGLACVRGPLCRIYYLTIYKDVHKWKCCTFVSAEVQGRFQVPCNPPALDFCQVKSTTLPFVDNFPLLTRWALNSHVSILGCHICGKGIHCHPHPLTCSTCSALNPAFPVNLLAVCYPWLYYAWKIR
jgi:hypothetical protein